MNLTTHIGVKKNGNMKLLNRAVDTFNQSISKGGK